MLPLLLKPTIRAVVFVFLTDVHSRTSSRTFRLTSGAAGQLCTTGGLTGDTSFGSRFGHFGLFVCRRHHGGSHIIYIGDCCRS